MKFKSR